MPVLLFRVEGPARILAGAPALSTPRTDWTDQKQVCPRIVTVLHGFGQFGQIGQTF